MATTLETEQALKVGDFFVCSWGYDQTNVDFYKVVGLTPKGVKVQKWTSACIGGEQSPSERVVPGETCRTWTDWSACEGVEDYWDRQALKVERDFPILTKIPNKWGSIRINSYSSAFRWDGTSMHQTGSGWGH